MSVKSILSFFHFIVWLLERTERNRTTDVNQINNTMTRLIVQREAASAEAAKAAAAKRKIKELLA